MHAKTGACNIQRIFQHKKLKLSLEKNNIFNIFSQSNNCGCTLEPPCQGGSNEYPQSMFWMKNKKNWYTHVNVVNPSLTLKSGIYGVYVSRTCFPDVYAKTGARFNCLSFLRTKTQSHHISKPKVQLSFFCGCVSRRLSDHVEAVEDRFFTSVL